MTLIIDKKIVTLADTKRLPHWVAKPTQMLGLHHLIPCQKSRAAMASREEAAGHMGQVPLHDLECSEENAPKNENGMDEGAY